MSEWTMELMKPAKHGFTLDLSCGGARVHVRCFEFGVVPYQGGEVELPVEMTEERLLECLQRALDEMRARVPALPSPSLPVSSSPSLLGEVLA